MTTAALSVTLTKHGLADTESVTTTLAFTGVRPTDQTVLHILCEAFTYTGTHEIKTADGVNVTIVHDGQLSAERLRRRIRDIASPRCSGTDLEITSTTCASTAKSGAFIVQSA